MTPTIDVGVMQIRTLGSLELLEIDAGGPAGRVMGAQKPLALLCYLALAPGRRATRDQLVDLLWGNMEVERGRRTLRQTIYTLRQRLGDAALVSDGELVTLTVPFTVDCEQFLADIAAGAHDAAWARYTGHFVPDFAAPGTREFEHWADERRERLRAAWLSLGDQLIARAWERHDPRAVVAIAGRMVDDAPDRVSAWLALVRALVLAGDRVAASAEAQRMVSQLRRERIPLSPEVSALVQEATVVHPAPTASVMHAWPRVELTGREREFAAMLAEWQGLVRDGTGRTVVVRGSPGIGKTVLLDEFVQRVRTLGAPSCSVRARRVDRDTPFALAAALAEALAELPGALGVSPSSAEVLIGLSPTLSAVYRAATARADLPTELPRLRARAVEELIGAVSEDRPLLLTVDDVHWGDEASRQLLASLADSARNHAVLLVLAMRPVRYWVAPEDCPVIDLSPLSREQVEGLVAGVAKGTAAVLHDITDAVYGVSGGVPLLVLSALELCRERQLLEVADGSWQCADADALRRGLGQGGILEKLLTGLPAGGRDLLATLAECGCALPEPVLLAAVPEATPAMLDQLITRGLLVSGLRGIEIAHDELADAALAVLPPAIRRTVLQRAGQALLQHAAPVPSTLQMVGRLYARADDRRVAEVFARYLAVRNAPELWRRPMEAVGDFLGDAATPTMLTRLANSVAWHDRVVRGRPQLTRAAGFSAVLLVLLVTLGALGLGRPRAVAITMRETENRDGFLWEVANRPTGFHVLVDLVDGHVMPTPRGPDSVRLSFVRERGDGELRGTLVRPVVDGRAEFTDVRLTQSASGRLVAQANGLPSVRTERLHWVGVSDPGRSERLQIAGGRINGQAVDSLHRRIVVKPGATLEGQLHIASTTVNYSAAVLAGAVALWGDRRENFIVLLALPSHGESLVGPIPFRDVANPAKQLRAPTVPGRYRVVLLSSTETEMQFIASRTNWVGGTPHWNDGNDIADLPPALIDQLDRTGTISWPREVFTVDRTKALNRPELLTGTVLEVEVRR